MKERPIQFPQPHADEMVRAILDGRKTQMRRPVKVHSGTARVFYDTQIHEFYSSEKPESHTGLDRSLNHLEPLGFCGDRLWVRETWAAVDCCDKAAPRDFGSAVWYQADDSGPHAAGAIPYKTDKRGKWRPSTQMPRWASRITLEISSVRVERVQDITDFNAYQEGVKSEAGRITGPYCMSYKQGFCTLWQSTYGTWNANPWVWVYEFRRVKL